MTAFQLKLVCSDITKFAITHFFDKIRHNFNRSCKIDVEDRGVATDF